MKKDIVTEAAPVNPEDYKPLTYADIDLHGHGKQKRSCGSCYFSDTFRPNQNILQSVLICRKNPPQFFLAITPQGMVPAMAPPQVQAETWCYQWEPLPVANDSADKK